MSCYETNFHDLNVFVIAREHFKEFTPNRWELIAEFVRSRAKDRSSEDHAIVVIGKRRQTINKDSRTLDLTKVEDCRKTNKLFPMSIAKQVTKEHFSQKGKNAMKSIILLPDVTRCCKKNIRIDSRPSYPIVYTMSGSYVGALFHGECYECKTKYYPSYKVLNNGERVYSNFECKSNQYFQVTSCSVFSVALLRDISNNICVNGATLQSRATVYNLNFREVNNERLSHLKEFNPRLNCNSEFLLNEERVNDAWFLWIVVNIYQRNVKVMDKALKIEYDKNRKRLDTEKLCQSVWNDICKLDNPWVMHKCEVAGCAEGYVTVDGNEYLKRSKCAFPKEKVRISRDLPDIYRCCPNSPLNGGKDRKPSKFCRSHQSEDVAEFVEMPPEFDDVDKENGILPEDTIHGCKKKENISLFFETTAGMLALIRPCGIVVSMTEMLTCESQTQVFLFLLRTFTKNIECFQRLKYVGYDRACGLVPFLRNQCKNGSAGAKLLLDNVKFLVDIFHVSKHTEEACMPLDNPNCFYHPLLPKFSEIHGANTESCEQGFRRLNIYFNLTRKMTQFKRNVLFWFVNDCFNKELELQLKSEGKM